MSTIKDGYQPLYQNIYNDIKEKIEKGELVEGDRLATEFEIMEQYAVSRITATRALQELAQQGYIQRFRSKGSFVCARKDGQGTGTSSAFRNTLAFILPFSADTIPPLLDTIQQAALEQNLMVSIFNSNLDHRQERVTLEHLAKADIAGLISYPIESHENLPYYTDFLFRGVPVVSIDKTLGGLGIPCIKTDNENAAYDLTQYLIAQGHREIAFYSHTLNDENENLRFRGYLRALIDNGIHPREAYFLELSRAADPENMVDVDNAAYHSKVNLQLRGLMALDTPPTALFCAYDLLAAYVEQQAHALDIAIPQTLSLVGFDNLSLCDHLQIPLTTAAQNYPAMGRKAVELILKLRDKQPVEPQYLFNAPIYERVSVRKLP